MAKNQLSQQFNQLPGPVPIYRSLDTSVLSVLSATQGCNRLKRSAGFLSTPVPALRPVRPMPQYVIQPQGSFLFHTSNHPVNRYQSSCRWHIVITKHTIGASDCPTRPSRKAGDANQLQTLKAGFRTDEVEYCSGALPVWGSR